MASQGYSIRRAHIKPDDICELDSSKSLRIRAHGSIKPSPSQRPIFNSLSRSFSSGTKSTQITTPQISVYKHGNQKNPPTLKSVSETKTTTVSLPRRINNRTQEISEAVKNMIELDKKSVGYVSEGSEDGAENDLDYDGERSYKKRKTSPKKIKQIATNLKEKEFIDGFVISDDEYDDNSSKDLDVLAELKTIRAWKPIEKIDTKMEHFDDSLTLATKSKKTINALSRKQVIDKYKEINYFPEGLTEPQLEERVNNHLDILKPILKNLSSSYYYKRAKSIFDKSTKSTISAAEFATLDKEEMFCGYYGSERQTTISGLIADKYKWELDQLEKQDKVIQFFTLDTFVLNFLTQELVTSMIMTDLNITKKKAIETMKSTNDYGFYITNEMPFIKISNEF